MYIVLVLMACLTVRPGVVAQAPSSPLTSREHPRLFVNSRTWSEIAQVLGTGGVWRDKFQNFVDWMDQQYETAITKDEDSYALNFAFLGLMAGGHPSHPTPVPGIRFRYTGLQYSQRALELYERHTSAIGKPASYASPILYDWTWHAMTDTQRAFYGSWLVNGALEDSETNKWVDSGDVGAMSIRVMRGLATLGDGHDDAWAAAAVEKFEPWFRSTTRGVTLLNSLWGGNHGGFFQGTFYGSGDYTTRPLNLVEEAYRTALDLTPEEHYAPPVGNVFRYYPRMMADYIVGAFPRTYSSSHKTDGYQYWWYYNNELSTYGPPVHSSPPRNHWRQLLFTSGLFARVDSDMAGLAKWLIEHRVGDDDSRFYVRDWIWGRPIFGRGSVQVTAKSPADIGLPLSARRDQGMWVFRTSWSSNIDEPVVMLLANKWIPDDYGFRHTGAFHVYRKGPMIHRGYGTDGHHNKNGIGGSIMVFPDRMTPPVPQNGFAFYEYPPGAERVTMHTGGVDYLTGSASIEGARAVREWLAAPGRAVDYVALDLSKLYSPEEVVSYIREFVYFRPNNPTVDPVRLVIFDRPTVRDGSRFGKTWLLWPAGEPVFANGTGSPGPSRGPTGTHGKWHSDDTSLVTVSNTLHGANGKMWLTPMLPVSRRVIKVGGPNASGQGFYYTGNDPSVYSHEFETPFGYIFRAGTYGINSKVGNDYPEYAGAWHLEIEDRGADATTAFLNVIEVGDSGGTQSQTSAVVGTGFVGARVGNRIALFSERGLGLASGSFVAPTAGTFGVLVTGLRENAEYEVTTGTDTFRQVASPGGALYFERALTAGATVTVRATGVTVQPPNAPRNLNIR